LSCISTALFYSGDTMRKVGDILVAIFFLSFAMVFTIGGIRLRLGTPTEPQPGFFPFLGGVTLIILAGILLVLGWRGKSSGTQAFGKIGGPLILIVGLAAYVAALEITGYIIATTVLSALVLRILETKSLLVIFIISLVLGVGSYLVFHELLGVPLPSGVLARFW
jgi:putative tricarboxylic transport membrane protein